MGTCMRIMRKSRAPTKARASHPQLPAVEKRDSVFRNKADLPDRLASPCLPKRPSPSSPGVNSPDIQDRKPFMRAGMRQAGIITQTGCSQSPVIPMFSLLPLPSTLLQGPSHPSDTHNTTRQEISISKPIPSHPTPFHLISSYLIT